jgi:hypothetical protein
MAGEGYLASNRGFLISDQANNYKIAAGVHTTASAADTVVSGLATVVAVIVSLQDDPTHDNTLLVSGDIGDQAGSPAAGSFYIDSHKATATNNVTPVDATTFGKDVAWIAIGT